MKKIVGMSDSQKKKVQEFIGLLKNLDTNLLKTINQLGPEDLSVLQSELLRSDDSHLLQKKLDHLEDAVRALKAPQEYKPSYAAVEALAKKYRG